MMQEIRKIKGLGSTREPSDAIVEHKGERKSEEQSVLRFEH